MLTLPNILTLSRILVIPGILWGIYVGTWQANVIALGLFMAASLTDFFDGYIARSFHQTSALGKFLDPIADKLLIIATLFILVGSYKIEGIHLIPTILIACREIFISGLREFLSDYTIHVPVNMWGKIKTSSQMVAIVFFITYPFFNPAWHIYEIACLALWVSGVLTLVSGITYLCGAYKKIDKL